MLHEVFSQAGGTTTEVKIIKVRQIPRILFLPTLICPSLIRKGWWLKLGAEPDTVCIILLRAPCNHPRVDDGFAGQTDWP